MTTWEIALQILKFIALGVSTASGWYASFNDTLDKKSDPPKLTNTGRVVFSLLIVSSAIALLSQTLETKNTVDKLRQDKTNKETADVKESQSRQDQLERLNRIIETAKTASDNSDASAKQSAVAVTTLSKVMDAEEVTGENTWRLERPFGSWEARLVMKNIPVTDREREWVADSLKQWRASTFVNPIGVSHSFEYTPEERDTDKLKNKVIGRMDVDLFVVTDDPNAGHVPTLSLSFYPKTVTTALNFDHEKNVQSFDITVGYVGGTKETNHFGTWVDLYGSEMTVTINGSAKGQLDVLYIGYEDTIEPHELDFECDDHKFCIDSNNLEGTMTEPVRFMRQCCLAEKILGIVPRDYQHLFPNHYSAIKARIRNSYPMFLKMMTSNDEDD